MQYPGAPQANISVDLMRINIQMQGDGSGAVNEHQQQIL